MSTTVSTYDIPAPAQGAARVGLLVPLLGAGMVGLALLAVWSKQWLFVVPVLLLALSAGVLLGMAARARRLGAVRVGLDDAGMEIVGAGQPTRYVAWRDVVGVQTDGELVEVHVAGDADSPRGLAIATPGRTWPQWEPFTDEMAKRLDASRGYTNRLCGLDDEEHPVGGCANALGCAGHATCQATGAH